MVHLDAFCWVNRDSYLPQGNRGLKAVTRCKLGYDPVEVDPEDMLRFARERPEHMASYSVSDAVATYYLYTTYVHNFIFSLSTIIPMGPEDVLRKGSGTLCEALLMVEAYRGHIVCPNKEVDGLESFYNGHLLESETYIGGHVECLEAGVFRADIANKFTLIPSALQMLIDHVDRDLTFALEVENGIQRSDVSNYDDVKQEIVMALEMLRDSPVREEMPMIYHLDVGAMYPNIILTNRLQPSAIVSRNDCAACDFNRSENNCKRNMTWAWRGDYSPASLAEYNSVKRQLAYEKVGDKLFSEMTEKEQASAVKARLNKYSQGVYKKTKITKTEERVHTVCMRENSFYVDTVRAFRDRRYDYKLLTKQWKGKRVAAEKAGDAVAKKIAEAKEVLMDSLQVAHKCILNSFYGYVMRKGARWRSMEMAGIVTHTGAQLITQARILVEQVGRPLELDTDGIWCILPSSFPQDYKLKRKDGGSVHVDYPCAMLNADVHDRYTNHQYQDLQNQTPLQEGQKRPSPRYATHSECSIYFELDGPYKAMVLPASPEEGKLLKKKYAVFNFDNTIAELKGFELKRRGELELVKIFQSQVFDQFLEGTNLQESYEAVGKIANQWLDVLDTQGATMDDDELMELISEKKTISKTLDEYEGRKATSLTTAERLSDFLGADMVKDKGLNCNLILSRLPAGAPVTERAIPVAIFSAEPAVRTFYLRKWLKSPSLDCEDFRHVVDWEYYKDRLGVLSLLIPSLFPSLLHRAN
jgi:DNA polymerase epsilon subunit 1